MTNQPAPVILSDEALAEIEAREPEIPYALGPSLVSLTVAERDALCATVRALESALRKADEIVVEAAEKNAGLQLANTALREQLAGLEDTNKLAGLRIVELESRLAQVEKERSINLCGDVTHCATCAEAKDFKP